MSKKKGNKIRAYTVTFSWTMCKTVTIKARNKSEAERKAEDVGFDIDLDKDGIYVEDSFEIRETLQ